LTAAVQTEAPVVGVDNVQAHIVAGIGSPVVLSATLTNRSGRDDVLVGGSSPSGKVSLYAQCACATPEPTDPTTGIAGVMPNGGLGIPAGKSVSMAPESLLVLYAPAKPIAVGSKIEVTFRFMTSPPATVTAVVLDGASR